MSDPLAGCDSCSDGSCGNDGKGLPPGMLEKYSLNRSTSDGTAVWLEIADGRICDACLEAVGRIESIDDSRIFGIIFGGVDVKPHYETAFAYGVDTIYHVRGVNAYDAETYAEVIAGVCDRTNPAVLLFGDTVRGIDVSARTAKLFRTKSPHITERIEMRGRTLVTDSMDNVLMREPVFPQMAVLKKGIYSDPARQTGRKGTVLYWQHCGRQQPL